MNPSDHLRRRHIQPLITPLIRPPLLRPQLHLLNLRTHRPIQQRPPQPQKILQRPHTLHHPSSQSAPHPTPLPAPPQPPKNQRHGPTTPSPIAQSRNHAFPQSPPPPPLRLRRPVSAAPAASSASACPARAGCLSVFVRVRPCGCLPPKNDQNRPKSPKIAPKPSKSAQNTPKTHKIAQNPCPAVFFPFPLPHSTLHHAAGAFPVSLPS